VTYMEAIGPAIVVPLLLMLACIMRCKRRRKRRTSLLSIELPVLTDQGETSPHFRRVDLKDHLRTAVAQLVKEGTVRGANSKFAGNAKELRFGRPKDATLGIASFMQISDEAVRTGMNEGVDAICREMRASSDVARECLEYVLNGRAGSSAALFENSPYPRDCDENGTREDRLTLTGEGMTLDDFVAHPDSLAANLSRAHVLALRLYTSATYKVINDPLRGLASGERALPHDLPVTVAFIQDAIKKLRAVSAPEETTITPEATDVRLNRRLPVRTGELPLASVPSSQQFLVPAAFPVEASSSGSSPLLSPKRQVLKDLWRGLRDVRVDDSSQFMRDGGTDYAPQSTSSDLRVAVSYTEFSREGASPVLLRLRIRTFMDQGVDLAYLSCFPAEAERLYPPLTYLEPTRKQVITVPIPDAGRTTTFTIITVVPHFG
jgi:hypothetical protein